MTVTAWEGVSEHGGVVTSRLRIAEGWLYRVTCGAQAAGALTFVPAEVEGDTPAQVVSAGERTEAMPRLDD